MATKKAPVLKRPLLPMHAAAEYTGFTTRQLRRWIEERTLLIPVIKVYGRNYFDPDDLDRLVVMFPRELPAAPDAGRRFRKSARR